MAKNDPKKLEKALAKQARRDARKSKEQAKKDMIQTVFTGEINISTAQKWDLHQCLVTQDWQDATTLTQLVVLRRSSGGQIAAGIFLLDLGCLGIKNAHTDGYASYNEFETTTLEAIQANQDLEPCSLDFAAKMVKTAIAYARSLGFEPHKDAKKAMRMLGDAQPENCPDEIPTGVNGKPFYANGPYENPMRVINTLNRTVGEGNYEVMLIDPEDMDEDFDDDDFGDDFDEDSEPDDETMQNFLESKEFQELLGSFEKFVQDNDDAKVIDVKGRST
jgi:hypothetical protein